MRFVFKRDAGGVSLPGQPLGRQRKAEEALFKVRFVPGAPAGCRRYVVTVTKDGWLTTALPMEKCGPQPRQARRG